MVEKRREPLAGIWVVPDGGDVPAETLALSNHVQRSVGSRGDLGRDRIRFPLDSAVECHHPDGRAQLETFGDLWVGEQLIEHGCNCANSRPQPEV